MKGIGVQVSEMTASLRGLSRKLNSRTWECFTGSGLRLVLVQQDPQHPQTSSGKKLHVSHSKDQTASEPQTCQKHPNWAKVKRTGLLLSGPKATAQDVRKFKVLESERNGETQDRVKFSQYLMIWGRCHLLAGPLGFYQIQSQCRCVPGDFITFLAVKLYGNAHFLSQSHWETIIIKWFADHVVYCGSLARYYDPKLTDNLWVTVMRTMEQTFKMSLMFVQKQK